MDSREQAKELLCKAFEQTELQEHAGDLADIIEAYVDARVYQILREIFHGQQKPVENAMFYSLQVTGAKLVDAAKEVSE